MPDRVRVVPVRLEAAGAEVYGRALETGRAWPKANRVASPFVRSLKTIGIDASLAGGTVFGVANPKAWVAIAGVCASARLVDSATADAAAIRRSADQRRGLTRCGSGP